MLAKIGIIVAGSLFATAKRVAMSGAIPAAIAAIWVGVATVGSAAAGTTMSIGASVASVSMGALSVVGAGVGAATEDIAGIMVAVSAIGSGVGAAAAGVAGKVDGMGAVSAIASGIGTAAGVAGELAGMASVIFRFWGLMVSETGKLEKPKKNSKQIKS